MNNEEKIKSLKDIVEWHIEDYTLKDDTIRSFENAYDKGWYEAMLLIKGYLDK